MGQVLSLSADVEDTKLLRREDSSVFRVVWNAHYVTVAADDLRLRCVPVRPVQEVSDWTLVVVVLSKVVCLSSL